MPGSVDTAGPLPGRAQHSGADGEAGRQAQRGSALALPGLSPCTGASAAALHPPRQGSQPQPPPRGPTPVTVQPRPFTSALPTVVPLQLWNLLWLSLSPARCSGASEPWPLL